MDKLINLALVLAQTLGLQPPAPRRVHPLFLALGIFALVLCCAVAYGCLLTALWLFLLPYLGVIGTPLAIAGVALLKAVIIVVWLRYGARRGNRPAPLPLSASVPIAAHLAEAAALVKEHKGSALAAAVLVGMMAARRED